MRWGGWMQGWAASRANSASGEVVKDVFFLLSLMFISIISDRCLASWWWPWFEVTVSSVAVLLARRTERNVHSLFLTNWKQLEPNLPWHCQVEAKERKNRMKSLWVHGNLKKIQPLKRALPHSPKRMHRFILQTVNYQQLSDIVL